MRSRSSSCTASAAMPPAGCRGSKHSPAIARSPGHARLCGYAPAHQTFPPSPRRSGGFSTSWASSMRYVGRWMGGIVAQELRPLSGPGALARPGRDRAAFGRADGAGGATSSPAGSGPSIGANHGRPRAGRRRRSDRGRALRGRRRARRPAAWGACPKRPMARRCAVCSPRSARRLGAAGGAGAAARRGARPTRAALMERMAAGCSARSSWSCPGPATS